MIERQELFCHHCQNYVQFDLDTEQNGEYVLRCPACGHQHMRTVIDGQITESRWGSANGPNAAMFPVSNITSTSTSTFTTYQTSNSTATTSVFLYNSWMNSSAVINGVGIITGTSA